MRTEGSVGVRRGAGGPRPGERGEGREPQAPAHGGGGGEGEAVLRQAQVVGRVQSGEHSGVPRAPHALGARPSRSSPPACPPRARCWISATRHRRAARSLHIRHAVFRPFCSGFALARMWLSRFINKTPGELPVSISSLKRNRKSCIQTAIFFTALHRTTTQHHQMGPLSLLAR